MIQIQLSFWLGQKAIRPGNLDERFVDRQQQESIEQQHLAPMAMSAVASRGRMYAIEPDPYRTDFQRDRDRIVHARAFRRLAYKTQVFINDEGDLYRTRLTHTLEVAQLSRALSRRLGLNEDLTECIALTHDLGHPPFGHRGEDLLNELMQEHGGFDHHRQTLRILEQLETRYAECPGLNLTYEVRESAIKHGGDTSGVPQRYRPEESRLLEALVVDAVDSVAYDCHDIDDALRAGVLKHDQLHELELWRGAWHQAEDRSARGTSRKLLTDRALRIIQDHLLDDLAMTSQKRIAHLNSVSAVRAHPQQEPPLIRTSSSMQEAVTELEAFMFETVYRDWRVNRVFHKARRILAELFGFFVHHPDSLPDEHQQRVASIGVHRAVADYLAGMTDRFAQDEYQRVFQPYFPVGRLSSGEQDDSSAIR